jgi:uncharacterized protein (DUF433 family)
MSTSKEPLITSTPDILGGTPVFGGTRVPVQTLIEYLEGARPSTISSTDFQPLRVSK